MQRTQAFVVAALIAVLGSDALSQQSPPLLPSNGQAPRPPATLAGVVRDSTGAPIESAEVVLRDTKIGTRTDAQGRFSLESVPPGEYTVWFRRLGYGSLEYAWDARAGKTEVSVVLHRIPRRLDPVKVRAEEDKRAAAHASIMGTVVDSAGAPVEEAEVQLVGANIAGVTRARGDFLFKPLGVGTYIMRVRKLGYTPTTKTVQLVENDDREVVIRLHKLPTQLEPVVVLAQSGYGVDDSPWDDLERRIRWRGARSYRFGPEELRARGGLPLDLLGLDTFQFGRRPTSIPQVGKMMITSHDFSVPGDACILFDGKEPSVMPISVFAAKDLDLLEFYPSGSDISRTLRARFHDPVCASPLEKPDPPYWVLWLKK